MLSREVFATLSYTNQFKVLVLYEGFGNLILLFLSGFRLRFSYGAEQNGLFGGTQHG